MSHYIVVIPMHMCVIILVLFKKCHHPRTNIVRMRRVIWLQTSPVYLLGRRTLSPSS
jgi:hypothetical protein